MEWGTLSISVWFFPRGSAEADALINGGAADVNVGSFGAPLAHFEGNTCSIADNLADNFIIFNTNFCGSSMYHAH
jgi:hypothetical protein